MRVSECGSKLNDIIKSCKAGSGLSNRIIGSGYNNMLLKKEKPKKQRPIS